MSQQIKTFEDLVVWQEAHKLTLLVYKMTNDFPASEKFNLTSQLRRAVVSVESCIAEGFARYHYKDRLNFYYDSRGSLAEVQSQTIDAKDLLFVSKANYEVLISQIKKVSIILGGLIQSTRNR